MSFGDDGAGAVGYLIGEEQAGMRYMFTMMNNARIGVAMEGLAISERVYQQALEFAAVRKQGTAIGATSESPIIEHPDVRRMLLTMKAYVEAMRGLLYTCAEAFDRERHAESAEEREAAGDLVALLTPISKAWSTDLGVELSSLGIQVHGGMGYVEETGVAQFYRDSRIAPIYEGTNGIQAIDLVLRKLPLRQGRGGRRICSTESRPPSPRRPSELSDLATALDDRAGVLAHRHRSPAVFAAGRSQPGAGRGHARTSGCSARSSGAGFTFGRPWQLLRYALGRTATPSSWTGGSEWPVSTAANCCLRPPGFCPRFWRRKPTWPIAGLFPVTD